MTSAVRSWLGGPFLRRAFVSLAWTVAAVVIALGSAGIVGGLDHLPATGARPELTYSADREIAPGLDAATADLRVLSSQVDALAGQGRDALTALVSSDTPGLQAAISAGDAQVGTIAASARALSQRLAALPAMDAAASARYSPATIARYATLVAALPAVDALGDDWARLAAGSVPAVELTGHLAAHDRIAGQAVQLGAAGKYAAAIKMLASAKAELAAARKVRDQLATLIDTSTLDTWIDRNATYDAAVGDLWAAVVASPTRVTAAVRAAATREQAAKAQLPADTSALVVILGDVARGGLNQAVIAIEVARGRLFDALAAATAPATPDASPALD
ncbi:MAG TPA: hypothetical protein VIH94_03815 [Candidatus Limnocylindrales bacterium]